MRNTRIRQIARLQKLAQPFLKRKGDEDEQWTSTIEGAANHAAVLAFLIRYGKPRADEPLSRACERCSESAAWKDCCEEFKSLLLWRPDDNGFKPYNMDVVNIIGGPLRHFIISTFSGVDEKQKLDAVFASAPPWLLWFTFADFTAKLLGLKLPDVSEVTRFMRSKADFDIWWGLPAGKFDGEPWPRDHEHEPLARTDLTLLRSTTEGPIRKMTRRELMREHAIFKKSENVECEEAWPVLMPAGVYKLSPRELLSLVERNRHRDFHHATIDRPSPASRTRFR